MEKSINFNVGDIVQLKSGGQKMTIELIEGTTRFKAKYLDYNQKEFRTIKGELSTLIHVKKDE